MKRLLIFLLTVALFVCLCSCKSESTEITDSSSLPDTSESEETQTLPAFKQGVWGVNNYGVAAGIYYFTDTKSECSYHVSRGGNGIPFDYEIKDGKYIFHMGGIEDNSEVSVTFKDDEHATLVWKSDGRSEEIIFIDKMSYDELNIDEGLGDIILEY